MKLDILVMAAHPDDAELACSGTIASQIQQGKKVGIVDFTRGELGTRGTPEIRIAESAASTAILGIHARENLGIRDGFFRNDEESQQKLIQVIRKYQPDIVLANALEDRHPDHGKGAQLAIDACFLSGLRKIETQDEQGNAQTAWRPKHVFHYIQDRYLTPDFVIDISAHWDVKEQSIRAFKSQFFDPNSTEPDSYISSPDFLEFIRARSMEMGHKIGVKYGEGYQSQRTMGLRGFDAIL
ncbi:bacillithiol biosynthesis deacetylase BshB1 [Aquirufa nivalisilvae]|uniref:bacillithiol biosynthesis deacetylase BshB1 n=1 Tax=Aquirufa nivalisilvae TaxID=2516557 RepID=UPI0022A947FF|nr:bacillithiol biosynthesis deacetylase BshB1 [Aquirufa nivalisilvae]MCZ2482088.1 bacillithiol biosynthesis deacetylase BshB1 [Aquirufa nivalisilvae]